MSFTWPPPLDDVKAQTNIDNDVDDDELEDQIAVAVAILTNHPEYRVGDVVAATEYTEWADAGSDTIIVKHHPVTAVTSITEYTGTASQVIAAEPLDGGTFTGYGWDYQDGTGANGILIRTSGGVPARWCGNRVKVVYTAGSADVPADVWKACLLLVESLWEDQRGGGTTRPMVGLTEDEVATSPGYLLPFKVEQALAPYRREPRVA